MMPGSRSGGSRPSAWSRRSLCSSTKAVRSSASSVRAAIAATTDSSGT